MKHLKKFKDDNIPMRWDAKATLPEPDPEFIRINLFKWFQTMYEHYPEELFSLEEVSENFAVYKDMIDEDDENEQLYRHQLTFSTLDKVLKSLAEDGFLKKIKNRYVIEKSLRKLEPMMCTSKKIGQMNKKLGVFDE